MASQPAETQKRVWLLLEDDMSLRELITTMFELWQVETLVFESGYKAMDWLEKVAENKHDTPLPELALMDIRVPGPLGHEVAGRIRSTKALAHIPIALMTAFRVDTDERMQIEKIARPDVVMTKPLPPPDELKRFLENLIKQNKEKSAESAPAAEAKPAEAAASPVPAVEKEAVKPEVKEAPAAKEETEKPQEEKEKTPAAASSSEEKPARPETTLSKALKAAAEKQAAAKETPEEKTGKTTPKPAIIPEKPADKPAEASPFSIKLPKREEPAAPEKDKDQKKEE